MHMVRTRGATARKLTYEDYATFPDDGHRHELIDGVHYVTSSRVVRHQVILGRLSPGTRRHDQRTKLELYDREDVGEYWIVDPVVNTIRVYRRADGRLAVAAELTRDAGDRLPSPLFPGLSLALARALAP